MSAAWAVTYLGLIVQVSGLAFFVLGVSALLGMRRDSGVSPAAHLGWLVAFGMLHGLQQFIEGERLHNPAAWLVVLDTALMVISFVALLESGRRLWNERPGSLRLAALPLYVAAGAGTLALMLAAPVVAVGLELGARYLLGAPGAALTGLGLLAQARAAAHTRGTVSIPVIHWLRIAALAMLGYAALSLFLSPGSGQVLADWLPTTADFLAITGLPVQLARALCAVLLAVGFLVTGLRSGTDRIHGLEDLAPLQTDEALRRMQAMVETSPQPMGWSDPDGKVRYFNEALRTLLAVPADVDVSGYRLRDFYDQSTYEQIESTVLPAAVAHGSWIGEAELMALDGRRVPTLHSVFVLRDEAGGLLAFANVLTDLSDTRAAQRDLHIKETAIDASTSAIALAGMDGALTYVNQTFVDLWGLAGPEEALGRSALSFWEQPDQAQAVVEALASTGYWKGELRGVRADGALMDVQLTGTLVVDHDGKPLCMMGSFLDVTENNQARRALQEERDFARSLLDTAPAIILLLDPQGLIRHVNPWFERVTGYSRDEVVGKDWFATFLPERDQARVRALFADAIHGQPVRGNVNCIVTRDGRERAIEWHALTLQDVDGQVTGLLSIGMDVTEQEASARAVREQARLLDYIFRYSQDCMAVLDKDYNFVRVTDSYARVGGSETSAFAGKNHFEMYPSDFKDDADEVKRSKLPYHKTERPFVYAQYPERGTTYWDVDFVPVLDAADEIELFLLTIKDVTQRRRHEEELTSERNRLQRSEALLRSIIDAAPVPMALNNGRQYITYVNASFTNTFGYELQDIPTLADWWPKAYPEEAYRHQVAERWQAELDRAARTGTAFTPFEVTIRHKDGGEKIVLASAAILDSDLSIVALLDISGLKQAENSMRQSEARLNEAQRIAQVGSWELDLTHNRLYWSAEIFRLFELDPLQFIPSYEAFLEAIHPDDRAAVNDAYLGSLDDRKPYRITHRLLLTDGRVKWVEEQCETDFAPDGTPLFSRGTVQDVTERVLAEERLRQSLLEKETLLREIHHRVKNNLQVVSSLLNLQSAKLRDAASLDVFTEVRTQLRSMTLVHERLYSSGNLAHINFGDYLRELAPDILKARAMQDTVVISVEAADTWLPIETAMPCGLIVSELLTNALKHGFPNGRRGRVHLTARLEAGALVLSVADDGVGLPEGFDPAATATFGWQLIQSLAAQVNGKVDLARESGTVVRVVVPLASSEVPPS